MGTSFAQDDFGAGYFSLNYLKRLPVDRVKIENFSVKEVHIHPGDAAIIDTIIAMSKALNLSVIAEGVNAKKTLNMAKVVTAMKCRDISIAAVAIWRFYNSSKGI